MPPIVPSTPRAKVLVPYSSSMNRLLNTGPVNNPNPMAANATMTDLIVRICHRRANAASTEMGAGFASSMTSPRTSCFSN